jgi:hypothetical protein
LWQQKLNTCATENLGLRVLEGQFGTRQGVELTLKTLATRNFALQFGHFGFQLLGLLGRVGQFSLCP